MQKLLIPPYRDIKYNDQGGLEDMLLKVRHKDTTEEELIEILADILVEAFIWEQEHKGEKPESYSFGKKK